MSEVPEDLANAAPEAAPADPPAAETPPSPREDLDAVLARLPPGEAQELTDLLARIETKPGGGKGGARQSRSRLPILFFVLSVLSFGLALGYGPFVGERLPTKLKVQSQWIRKGALPEAVRGKNPSAFTVGQTFRAETQDLWGRPYRLVYLGSYTFQVHSLGPDGVDQAGGGDDIIVERKLAWSLASFVLYGDALLGVLGLIFAWAAAGTRAIALPWSVVPAVENARAIGILTVPAILSFLAVWWFGADLLARIPQRYVIPPRFVMWGSIGVVFLVAFFAIKAYRKGRAPGSRAEDPL